MARILLIDSDPIHSQDCTDALKQQGHVVTTCPAEMFDPSRRKVVGFDIAIVNLTAGRREEWRALDAACEFQATRTARPMILGVCTPYRGPRLKLNVERKGARFVYEE